MTRFAFTLQPLLDLRRRREQQAQVALAAVNQQRLNLERRLRQQQELIRSDKHALRGRLVGLLDTDALRLQAVSAVQGMRTAQRLAVELAGVHKRLSTTRAELVEATRARRAIELLRDRRYEQWRREQSRADAATIDELATNSAARQEIV